MKKINTFIKNGLILTISTLFLRLIAVLFNIFLSNKISSSLLGTFGIILSVFAFFLTIALSGINLSSTRLVSEDYSFNKSKNVILKNSFISTVAPILDNVKSTTYNEIFKIAVKNLLI